ncbi:MAG: hypothetical protein DRQ78_04100 [Epsilonproteobacteria bacterium]|nr:MAG: hypothetical protein DRQ78_04100 [Campylobacterota bacterium]
MGLPINFIDYSSSFMMARIEAEIYMRIYQYAAEDFRSTFDCNTAHQRIITWQTQSELSVSNYAAQIAFHIHEAPEGPTSPPIPQAMYQMVVPALPPLNLTGRIDNIAANFVIPSVTLSYIDLSFRSFNIYMPTFRRGFQIPIAYGPISLSLKLE